MNYRKTAFFVAAMCLSMFAYAELGTDLYRATQAARAAARYNTVTGLTITREMLLGNTSSYLASKTLGNGLAFLDIPQFVQVHPWVSSEEDLANCLVEFHKLTTPDVLQALYLNRMQNRLLITAETKSQFDLLKQRAEIEYKRFALNQAQGSLSDLADLPNILLLQKFQDPKFVPQNYAELEKTTEFPKFVTLNRHGIPVRTPETEQAELLKLYLLLGNPDMAVFNNTSAWDKTKGADYTPFVLTKEEQASAKRLMAKWQETQQIPEYPSFYELIEQAYNHMHMNTVPYWQVKRGPEGKWNVGNGYQFDPSYKFSPLYYSIQAQLVWSVTPAPEGFSLSDTYLKDRAHLIVLHTLLGGVDATDPMKIVRTIQAFAYLCENTFPTKENIAHLEILQNNLRFLFRDEVEKRMTKLPEIDDSDIFSPLLYDISLFAGSQVTVK